MKSRVVKKVLSGVIGLAVAISALCMPISVSAQQLATAEVAPKLYYSARSTVDSAALKNDIESGFLNYSAEIDISKYKLNKDITADQDFLNNSLVSAVYENPELFYLTTGYKYSYYPDGSIAKLVPQYSMSKAQYQQKKPQFDSAVNGLISGIDGLNDFQKVLTLHDRLAQYITYDLTAANAYDSYGALVDKRAVCQGYTLAYVYLLKLCGIKSVPVSSSSMQHMWNLVQLDGEYYHVDVTWDDESIMYGDNSYEITGRVNHKYFLRTDSEFKSIKTPHNGWSSDIVCDSTKYSDLFLRNDSARATESKTFCDENYIYYVKNNDQSSDIIRRLVQTGTEKVLYTVENGRWAQSGLKYTVWSAYNSRIAENNGELYFNESDKIRKINLSSGTVSDVCTLDIAGDECAIGLAIVDGKLKYDKLSRSNVVTQLIDTGVDISNPVVPTSPTQPTESTVPDYPTHSTAPTAPTNQTPTYGDATGDGKVTAADVLIIRKNIAGQSVTLNIDLSDVNKDGKLTAADVLIIRKHIAGQQIAPWN